MVYGSLIFLLRHWQNVRRIDAALLQMNIPS